MCELFKVVKVAFILPCSVHSLFFPHTVGRVINVCCIQCHCFQSAGPYKVEWVQQTDCTVEISYQYKQCSSLVSVCGITYVCVTFQSRACYCRFPAVVLLLVLFKEIN